jgi:cyclophilin family peptidyl-prolyl cis-trans isomerase
MLSRLSPLVFAFLVASLPCLMAQDVSEDVARLAEQAQAEVFEAAESPPAPSPTPRTSSGRTTFKPSLDNPSLWKPGSQHKIAVMELSFGGTKEEVMFELFPGDAPKTVANFIDNCDTGSYEGLAFHRAIPGFIVQTGDPLTADEDARDRWGTGGEGKTISAEIKRKHTVGAVAMGRRGDKVNSSKRSNGYQFYFTLAKQTALDSKYTVFGQVISGMEVLQEIGQTPTDANDCPIARIEIESIKVIDHEGPMILKPRASGNRAYSKPRAAKGFFERLLERVW